MLLEWIAATIVVIVLIVLVGRVTHWVLGRSLDRSSTAVQIAAWRIAPDASVRAIRVLDHVHVLYERGRESTLLETLAAADFESQMAGRTDEPGRGLRLLRGRAPRVAGH